MSDKELLELAAKAAGIDLSFNIMLNGGDTPYITDSYISAYEYDEWNPLTDDGDALRLAVKIAGNGWCFAELDAPYFSDKVPCWLDQVDPNATTRRAIVRAAAEIGKSMK